MTNGYARASKLMIPAARSIIARELKERYQMTEQEIASQLGVAQAAVSKYLSGKYSKAIKDVEKGVDMASIANKISMIAQGKKEYANAAICTICRKGNNFDCKFSKAGI